MDPTARPSQPLPLYRLDTTTPLDLLACLQHCMQALPSQPQHSLTPMLAAMVQAASRIVMAPHVQALCAQHDVTFIEACDRTRFARGSCLVFEPKIAYCGGERRSI